MSYKNLVSIKIQHQYFGANLGFNFEIKPLKDTQHYLQMRGLMLKMTDEGFDLWYNDELIDHYDLKQAILQEEFKLVFAFTITDSSFFNYTNGIASNEQDKIFNFSNLDKKNTLKADNHLQSKEFVSEKDLLLIKDLPFNFFKKPFAFISIQLAPTLQPSYVLNFEAKSTYWRYIIVSDYLLEMENLQILMDQNQFKGPVPITLPNSQAAMVFESQKPIQLSHTLKLNCSLVQKQTANADAYFTIKRSLPTPNQKSISNYAATVTPSSTYSEMYIY